MQQSSAISNSSGGENISIARAAASVAAKQTGGVSRKKISVSVDGVNM